MYEQYTDKQIVEMLIPKLKKSVPELNWDEYLKRPGAFTIWARLISVIYKSGYIRSQLGRSFIIGQPKCTEPKQTEHWVPATKDNVKVGNKVRVSDEAAHKSNPDCYPNVGVVGVVINNSVCRVLPLIQWPKNSVGGDDARHCLSRYLEVLLCE